MLWARVALARVDGHVRRHAGAYVLFAVVFALGVALGALAARLLPALERDAVWQAAAPLGGPVRGGSALLARALAFEVGTVGLLWALGATVVGLPIAVAVVGMRGVAVGFACAFLVQALGPAGLLTAALGVVLPALLAVPAWLAVLVAGVGYGRRTAAVLLRGDAVRRPPGEDPLGAFTAVTLAAAGFAALTAAMDVGVSLPATHFVVATFVLRR